jgi:CHAT domain-containing protein
MVDESEGILGMTKAFFEAGTKSVVVSLWEVNDKYTSSLMKLYYKKLSDGYDKSEALRLAKIDFIKNYSPNPYFWSAFVLSGNTSSLELTSATDLTSLLIVLVLISLGGSSIIYLRRKIHA